MKLLLKWQRKNVTSKKLHNSSNEQCDKKDVNASVNNEENDSFKC